MSSPASKRDAIASSWQSERAELLAPAAERALHDERPRAIDASVPICSATSTGCHSGSRNSAPAGRVVPLGQQPSEHRDVLVVGHRHVVVVADEQAVEPRVRAAGARSIIQRAPWRTSVGPYPLRSEVPIFMPAASRSVTITDSRQSRFEPALSFGIVDTAFDRGPERRSIPSAMPTVRDRGVSSWPCSACSRHSAPPFS